MKMWQRAAFIMVAFLMLAPPTDKVYLTVAILCLGVAFMAPDYKE
jgi:hypothetical protein